MTRLASPLRTALLRFVPLLFGACLAAFGAQPSDAVKRTFDVPADAAEKSIRRFSEQSGLVRGHIEYWKLVGFLDVVGGFFWLVDWRNHDRFPLFLCYVGPCHPQRGYPVTRIL